MADGRFIWIGVGELDRGQVRIRIEAPMDVKIMREELIEASGGSSGR